MSEELTEEQKQTIKSDPKETQKRGQTQLFLHTFCWLKEKKKKGEETPPPPPSRILEVKGVKKCIFLKKKCCFLTSLKQSFAFWIHLIKTSYYLLYHGLGFIITHFWAGG